MKKANKKDEIPAEIDFSGAVRGKYAARFGAETTLVLLEPDVLKTFPDSDAVNTALRLLIKAGGEATRPRSATKKAS